MGSEPHDWELKGGTVVQNSEPSIPMGVVLWQCTECGVALTTRLTARHERGEAIVEPPEPDRGCY